MLLNKENSELTRLKNLLGLPEEFFVSCIRLAREEACKGQTEHHLKSYFGMKNWHELVANINSQLAIDEYQDWSYKAIKNLPVWVNDSRQIAFFISPMAKSGVMENREIELRRSFGFVAQNLCANNERELPFENAPERITYSKVPSEFEVWALVRQMESRADEIFVEFVKFGQNAIILERIPISSIEASEDSDDADVRENISTDASSLSHKEEIASSDIDIGIAEEQ